MSLSTIIIIQNIVPHYRKEFYNKLSEIGNVVLIHSGPPSLINGDKYLEYIIPSHKIGPFIIQVGLFKLLKKLKPNTIIASADIRNIISVYAMFRYEKKLKWIWWGADFGASKIATFFKLKLFNRLNRIIFYNEEIRNKFYELGLKSEILFVANNTFHVPNNFSFCNYLPKNIFLNVGSLDPRKQNDILIKAFNHIIKKFNKDIYLVLVGKGIEKQNLTELIEELSLQERVLLVGQIDDPFKLEGYYKCAIASVSFGQAGLAVLQSMAFGVPFITKKSAISGGEKFNIIHNYNGLLCSDTLDSLVNTLEELVENPNFSKRLGQNAYEYYNEKASIDIMVKGFKNAINFV